MNRKDFLKQTLLLGGALSFGGAHAFNHMNKLTDLQKCTDSLPKQSKKMPVLFTSHGNPLDIPIGREERAFWMRLFELGKELKDNFEVKAALVISAHWCTNNHTFVNNSLQTKADLRLLWVSLNITMIQNTMQMDLQSLQKRSVSW